MVNILVFVIGIITGIITTGSSGAINLFFLFFFFGTLQNRGRNETQFLGKNIISKCPMRYGGGSSYSSGSATATTTTYNRGSILLLLLLFILTTR
jgi:hypothetical protein